MTSPLDAAVAAVSTTSPGEAGRNLLEVMRERRDRLHRAMGQALDGAAAEQRGLRADEQRGHDKARARLSEIDERIDELQVQETRQAASAESRRLLGGDVRPGGLQHAYHLAGGETYRRGDASASFFRDLVGSRRGDAGAAERLQRNEQESRALGNTTGTGGSGGEFAPPGFMLEDFAALARPARVTADLLTRQELPPGVSSVNVPKVLTGTTVAAQSTQNTAVSQTDMTTSQLTSGITTLAGKQVISLQLIQQSGIDFDRIVLADLAADYARALDLQVLSGSGAASQLLGLLNVTGISQVAYTQATPAVAGAGGFYAAVNKAIAAVSTARYLPPTSIVMHPRRWSWVAAAFDGQNRPLVSPTGGAGMNTVAQGGPLAAQHQVGTMAGLPVFLDPNLPITLGAGANQDPVLVGRFEDAYLWETGVTAASFEAPYSDSMGVLLRVHGYSALVASRYPASVAVVNGSGTVAPVY